MGPRRKNVDWTYERLKLGDQAYQMHSLQRCSLTPPPVRWFPELRFPCAGLQSPPRATPKLATMNELPPASKSLPHGSEADTKNKTNHSAHPNPAAKNTPTLPAQLTMTGKKSHWPGDSRTPEKEADRRRSASIELMPRQGQQLSPQQISVVRAR
jgi:hypothetical protein